MFACQNLVINIWKILLDPQYSHKKIYPQQQKLELIELCQSSVNKNINLMSIMRIKIDKNYAEKFAAANRM